MKQAYERYGKYGPDVTRLTAVCSANGHLVGRHAVADLWERHSAAREAVWVPLPPDADIWNVLRGFWTD